MAVSKEKFKKILAPEKIFVAFLIKVHQKWALFQFLSSLVLTKVFFSAPQTWNSTRHRLENFLDRYIAQTTAHLWKREKSCDSELRGGCQLRILYQVISHFVALGGLPVPVRRDGFREYIYGTQRMREWCTQQRNKKASSSCCMERFQN